MDQKPNKFFQVGILLGYIATITINALANILPINGVNTGQLSDEIPNLFVPAGLTFSIWGVIYILLALFTGYALSNWFSKSDEQLIQVNALGVPFIISSIANICWIFLWHYRLVNFSLIAMTVILGSLIYMHQIIHRKLDKDRNSKWNWFVKYPISVYLGWITVATVANVTAVFVVNNWDGFGVDDAFWTILMIIIAGLITMIMLWKHLDVAYALVVVWAFVGIIIKRLDIANPPQNGIVIATIIMISAILGLAIVLLVKKTKKRNP